LKLSSPSCQALKTGAKPSPTDGSGGLRAQPALEEAMSWGFPVSTLNEGGYILSSPQLNPTLPACRNFNVPSNFGMVVM